MHDQLSACFACLPACLLLILPVMPAYNRLLVGWFCLHILTISGLFCLPCLLVCWLVLPVMPAYYPPAGWLVLPA
jgi:hypothetical protein